MIQLRSERVEEGGGRLRWGEWRRVTNDRGGKKRGRNRLN